MTQQRRLNNLMQHRVRDVLLVSSLYDAYTLQEDGHLTEKVYLEYKVLQLSSAPRFSHADSAEAALRALVERRFDLVLVVSKVQGMSVSDFARRVQERHPGVAVVLLTFDAAEHSQLSELRQDPALEGVFAWSGDAKILLALSKTTEDARNVDHDIEEADVRVILLVEDSIRFYSAYLAALYPELMMQSQSLFSEGLNRLQRLLRMRTRPKVLLAQDYEQACLLADRYRKHLLALISDVSFPRAGQEDPQAGIALVERVRRKLPDLPVLLQSANEDYREVAQLHQVQFVNKGSSRLLQQIRDFLRDYLGFGPFIFRMPDGREIRRAKDVQALATCIAEVPGASVEYHASRNHFSTWLMARSEFDLAALMRPQQVSDFGSVEELRSVTVDEIRRHTRVRRSGVISDFSADRFQTDSALQRIGTGSLGGKARGIAFLDQLLANQPDVMEAQRLEVRVPESFVLATNAFDAFLQENDIDVGAVSLAKDAQIAERFLAGDLPTQTMEALASISQHVRYPLAVRSSSLLEDDMLHPFVGIYGTVLLANQAQDSGARLAELARAVKLLYASTYYRRARRHLEGMGRRIEEEKMAVILQRLVGQPHGELFFPFCYGVAQSHNFYALPPQRAGEGAVALLYGLGPIGTKAAVRFSPAHPHLRPQHRSPAELAAVAQRTFRALHLGRELVVEGAKPAAMLGRHPLEAASSDATLPLAVSRFVPGARALAATDDGPGELIVTFDGLLQLPDLPLADTLRSILSLAVEGVGMPVELELCLDLTMSDQDGLQATLYPLQLRPVVRKGTTGDLDGVREKAQVLCRTPRAFGPSLLEGMCDVVVVKQGALASGMDPHAIALEIEAVNSRLLEEGNPYLLIGPGRWGCPERGGLPVVWSQIFGAKAIVEEWDPGMGEPPFGIGFFDEVALGGVSYLVIPPGSSRAHGPEGTFLHWPLLESHPALFEGDAVRHLRFNRSLMVFINDPDPGAEVLLALPPGQGCGTLPSP